MRHLLLVGLLCATMAKAGSNANEASFGMAYALTTVGYGFASTVFTAPPVDSFVWGATIAIALGTLSDLMPSRGSNPSLGNNLLYRGMGIAGSGLTIWMFRFRF